MQSAIANCETKMKEVHKLMKMVYVIQSKLLDAVY